MSTINILYNKSSFSFSSELGNVIQPQRVIPRPKNLILPLLLIIVERPSNSQSGWCPVNFPNSTFRPPFIVLSHQHLFFFN